MKLKLVKPILYETKNSKKCKCLQSDELGFITKFPETLGVIWSDKDLIKTSRSSSCFNKHKLYFWTTNNSVREDFKIKKLHILWHLVN